MKKVSVILPIYEIDCAMLKEAIESILRQTYSLFELIIVCDKYIKEVDEMLAQYELLDNRVIVIRNQHRLGIAESLNYGIRLSTGEYIARMDGDDISLPRRFEKQVEYLDCHSNVDVLFSMSGAINEVGTRVSHSSHRLTDTQIVSSLFVGNMLFHPTVMLRKKILCEKNCFYDGTHVVEDYDLWTRLMIAGAQFHQMKDVLYLYRVHSGQTTVKVKDSAEEDGLAILYNYIIGFGIDTDIDSVRAFHKYMRSIEVISKEDKVKAKETLKKIVDIIRDKGDASFLKKRVVIMNIRRSIKR